MNGLPLPVPVGHALTLGLMLAASPPLVAAGAAPTLEVRRTSGEIRLDGDLTDPGWRGAAVIDRFWETQPGDNVAPQAATQAWVTYDQRHLYIAIRAEDPDPSQIRAPFVERDKVYGTDDNVAVFLDTRGDGLTALELRVSPRGQQGDAVFSDASRNEDFAPDVFYDTAARITDFGWTAEMRIPFSSLRYSGAGEQAWSILVWRNYPREYRFAYHSQPIPRGSDCWICHAQPMAGLRDLPGSGGLVLAPYAAAQEVAERTGQKLLSTTATEIFLRVDPSQRFTRIGLDARIGDTIDLANEQVGTGVDMTLTATLRPWSRLTLDLVGGRRWLDTPRPEGGRGRLFTADVARVRALFHFDARAYLRVIGQWVGTRRDPGLYPYPVEASSADLEASVLFAYRLNWQTALFVGYGNVRALDPRNDLRPTSRQLFAKISYAFQR